MGSQVLKLIVEYDGTDFYGWQIQPDLRTVQGELEQALCSLTQQKIRIVGSGRTDTGVHALGQVVSFLYDGHLKTDVFQKGLNAMLPCDIRVLKAERAQEGFHARKHAIRRTYRYIIAKTERAIGRQYAWYPSYRFDLAPMKKAAQFLLGEHHWDAFAKPRPDCRDLASTVYEVQWQNLEKDIFFIITASRFFHSMIRLIIGTLMDVGRGLKTPDQFRDILISKDLSQAGAKAPACGLSLLAVEYKNQNEVFK